MKLVKQLYLGCLIASLLLIPAFKSQAYNFLEDSGVQKTGESAGYDTKSDQPDLDQTIGQNINLVLSFIGILFIILMLYGGITWMTAAGSEEKAKKAKGIIIDSVIGLIIVIVAYAITYFVFEFIFETTMTTIDPNSSLPEN